jgi:hypothetical protein
VRDALSLLDQSISYGNGSVMEKDIKAMLGLVHHDDILTILKFPEHVCLTACVGLPDLPPSGPK